MAGMGFRLPVLSKKEKVRCKVCDLLEMYEFGWLDRAMGNRFMDPIIDDIIRSVHKLYVVLPSDEQSQVEAYVNVVIGRYSE